MLAIFHSKRFKYFTNWRSEVAVLDKRGKIYRHCKNFSSEVTRELTALFIYQEI